MMKKKIVDSKMVGNRFECFGCFDPDDLVCRAWCQLSIRCAIAQNQYFDFEMVEDLVSVELESDRVQ